MTKKCKVNRAHPQVHTMARDLFPSTTDSPSLKIHLHRWIIIKACYYIRNMKLKRPSSANEYDTVADMEVDDPMSPNKAQLVAISPCPYSCFRPI